MYLIEAKWRQAAEHRETAKQFFSKSIFAQILRDPFMNGCVNDTDKDACPGWHQAASKPRQTRCEQRQRRSACSSNSLERLTKIPSVSKGSINSKIPPTSSMRARLMVS